MIVPGKMELGRARTRGTLRVLVLAGDAGVESRVGNSVEAHIPADGTVVENGLGCLPSRASRVGLNRVLSGLPPHGHLSVLWRNLQALSRRDLLRLRGVLEQTRPRVDWEVLTAVTGPGPVESALVCRLEALFEPDLTITID
jgi:hypothetical protein